VNPSNSGCYTWAKPCYLNENPCSGFSGSSGAVITASCAPTQTWFWIGLAVVGLMALGKKGR